MGLLTGSSSCVRFTVGGSPPSNFWDFVAERVAANSFRDIDDNMDEYSIGWVSVANMFDADFAYSSYAAADYVVLTMRVDERKVSPAVVKKCVMKEEERIKKDRQLPQLGRAVRLEIKERVRAELLRKSVPVPATYDLCWNLGDATLLFFSTNKKALSQLEDLFRDTFDMPLTLQIPWTAGERLVAGEYQAGFEDLRPALLI
ncbi:MAG: DNA recombination-dependent growth factor C [Desulfobulbus propionicus]|nr:MAG: DNA recombination-dependent growth factor C [Desulfobulbus propionicus]